MTIATTFTSFVAWIKSPFVERAVKTFVETTAAQAAVYSTIVPTAPAVKTSAAISVGATVGSLVWNGLIAWATNTKSAKLDALAAAIDKAVDARLAAQKTVPQVGPAVTAADVVLPAAIPAVGVDNAQ